MSGAGGHYGVPDLPLCPHSQSGRCFLGSIVARSAVTIVPTVIDLLMFSDRTEEVKRYERSASVFGARRLSQQSDSSFPEPRKGAPPRVYENIIRTEYDGAHRSICVFFTFFDPSAWEEVTSANFALTEFSEVHLHSD